MSAEKFLEAPNSNRQEDLPRKDPEFVLPDEVLEYEKKIAKEDQEIDTLKHELNEFIEYGVKVFENAELGSQTQYWPALLGEKYRKATSTVVIGGDPNAITYQIDALESRYAFGSQEEMLTGIRKQFEAREQLILEMRARSSADIISRLAPIDTLNMSPIDDMNLITAKTILLSAWSGIPFRELQESKSCLYRRDPKAPHFMKLDKDAEGMLSDSFKEKPSEHIESLLILPRPNASDTLWFYMAHGYDYSRLRLLDNKLVFKRVIPKKVRHQIEEIEVAAKAGELLKSRFPKGNIQAQEFRGVIVDKGNTYLVSDYFQNARELSSEIPEEVSILKEIQEALKDVHTDIKERNILVTDDPEMGKQYRVIDFETHPQGV